MSNYQIKKSVLAVSVVILVLVLASLACGESAKEKPTEVQTPTETVTAKPTATTVVQPTHTPTQEAQPTPTLLPPDTPTNTPTGTPSHTPTPTSTPEPEPFYLSGGLGLSREQWEVFYEEGVPDDVFGFRYGKYLVAFQADNVWYIECEWSAEDAVSLEDARTEADGLIPVDSQFVGTYSPEGMPELVVDLYMSESLKTRFDSATGDWWTGGEPGNFIVVYGVFDDTVRRMVISLGNNP